MPVFIDSHVNLHSEKFAGDCDTVIEAARAAGVAGMLTISDKIESTDAIRHICARYPFIWRSVGAHPHYAVDHGDLTAEFLVDLAEPAEVIGIGECGLDYHYEYSPAPDQKIVFQKHIEAAQETGLPLIIHTREADADMMAMLTRAMGQRAFAPLLHCYTSGLALAEAVMEMGGYISFSGIATFKNAQAVRDVAHAMPRDRIIIETDCPYLAPVPFRGRRCEPAHVVHVGAYLADMFDMSIDAFAQMTTDNFFRLFARADRAALGS